MLFVEATGSSLHFHVVSKPVVSFRPVQSPGQIASLAGRCGNMGSVFSFPPARMVRNVMHITSVLGSPRIVINFAHFSDYDDDNFPNEMFPGIPRIRRVAVPKGKGAR
jgi:hypothetical protein